MVKDIISFDDFIKLDLRVGRILECARKEGSEKLLRSVVDFGVEGKRVVLSGIAAFYQPEELVGKDFVFLVNLAPRKIMGEDSQAMLLCVDGEKYVPLSPFETVKIGSKIA